MILASDFDDTLYVKDTNIFNKNMESIQKFRSLGNKFAIITGRGISVRKYIEEYNIPYDYLICENGGMIYDIEDNIISSTYLEEDDIKKIIDIIKRDNLDCLLDTGSKYIDNINDNYDSLVCISIDLKTVLDKEKLLEEINNTCNTYNYISTNWINIINKNINKGIALDKLNKYLDEKYRIFSIGDAVNDIEMIINHNGAIMEKHEKELDNLDNKKYNTLSEYIEELIR